MATVDWAYHQVSGFFEAANHYPSTGLDCSSAKCSFLVCNPPSLPPKQ